MFDGNVADANSMLHNWESLSLAINTGGGYSGMRQLHPCRFRENIARSDDGSPSGRARRKERPEKATVVVARKLAVVLRPLWVTNQPYVSLYGAQVA